MMKRNVLLLGALALSFTCGAQNYWNSATQLKPFRFPMPPVGYTPEKLDLNGDGKQDAVKTIINGNMPVLWLDDDGNMKNGDNEGDFVNDCILVDRNADGKYDFIVKHADLNGDEKADIQFILDYTVGGKGPKEWNSPHYMVVIDDDNDGVFNYVDWNTVTLKCWEKNGLSDFYTDYSGNSTFLKMHRTTLDCYDLRYNWENPFLFYDYDKDGLTEIALRYCDVPYASEEAKAAGYPKRQYQGRMGWFSIGIDMDNDNCPGNDFDFDMTLHYSSKNAFEYHSEVFPLKNMRGLPEADKFFPDPRVRELTKLIFPSRKNAFNYAWNGKWDSARFAWDEDDDCGRWERVELYEDRDAFKVGSKQGGVDNHNQADFAGDRGEWDSDFSGGGDIYIGGFDGRVHLYGAERGVWRIDQNTNYFQGWDRRFQNVAPEKFATVEYLDTDNNGFFDTFRYDLDGDCSYETTVSLKELGISDVCKVIDVSGMKYKDYTNLFRKVSSGLWKGAEDALKVAAKYDVSPFWYGKMMNPSTLRERYNDGWWLQFYIFKDIEYRIMQKYAMLSTEGKSVKEAEDELRSLYRAYYSRNWKSLL